MQTTDERTDFGIPSAATYTVDAGLDEAYHKSLPPLIDDDDDEEQEELKKPPFLTMLLNALAYALVELRADAILLIFFLVLIAAVGIYEGERIAKISIVVLILCAAFFLKHAVGKLHSEISKWEGNRLRPIFAVKMTLIHALWWLPLSLLCALIEPHNDKHLRYSETFAYNPLDVGLAFGCSCFLVAYFVGLLGRPLPIKGEWRGPISYVVCLIASFAFPFFGMAPTVIVFREPGLSVYDAFLRFSRLYISQLPAFAEQVMLVAAALFLLWGIGRVLRGIFSPRRYSKENQQLKAELAKQVWVPVYYLLGFISLYGIAELVFPMLSHGDRAGQDLLNMMPASVLWLGLLHLTIHGAPFLAQAVRVVAIDSIRDKLTDEEYARIERAFDNTKELQFKEELGYWGWKRAAEHHRECDQATTSTLELWLHNAGVFTPHTPYHLKGKTTEDGITLALWQSRHDKDEALLKAAEADLVQGTAQAETAPDLEKRREAETKKEGAAAEVQRYKGQREVRPEALPAFGGQCAIHTINGMIKHVVLEVAAGDYSVRLYDELKNNSETKRANIQQDGELAPVDFSSDDFKFDNTELIVRRRGSEIEARLPLW